MIFQTGSHLPPSLFEDLDLEVTDFGTGFPPKADNFREIRQQRPFGSAFSALASAFPKQQKCVFVELRGGLLPGFSLKNPGGDTTRGFLNF